MWSTTILWQRPSSARSGDQRVRPKDTLAGQLIGHQGKPNIIFSHPSEVYDFANKRCRWETIPPMLDRASPLRVSHLRDPLGPETHFASESFIDEVAHAAGADPVAFRLRYLAGNARHAAVVKAVAEKARWKAGPNPNRGKGDIMFGRGVSYTERNGTVVAMIAEVEVERSSGRVWAKKFTVAHDCGQIINPGGLTLTIEERGPCALAHAVRGDPVDSTTLGASMGYLSHSGTGDAPEAIDIVLITSRRWRRRRRRTVHRTVPGAVATRSSSAGVRIRRVQSRRSG